MADNKAAGTENESSTSALGLLVLLVLAAWFALGYELQTLITFEVRALQLSIQPAVEGGRPR